MELMRSHSASSMGWLLCLLGVHKYTMFEFHEGRVVVFCAGSRRCVAKGAHVILTDYK